MLSSLLFVMKGKISTMLFTSYAFLASYVCMLFLYYLLPKRFQWMLLLGFSYFFYACQNPKYLFFLLASCVTVYATGIILQRIADEQKKYLSKRKEVLSKEEKKNYKQKMKSRQKRWMVLCLLLNLGILAGVKYMNFFLGNINGILRVVGSTTTLKMVDILLPMGISFYTLQAIGYVIDVYRGTIPAQKNFFKLSLFISFFPQLVQGPISKMGEVAETLYAPHVFEGKQVIFGLQRILWGFFKKLVIADCVLTGVTTIIGDLEKYNGVYVFIGMFLYTLQLYADFTGGIDITIGIAQTFGVVLPENFKRPYFSKTLKEYWRRWHITMCEWFRVYLFFPVSTSKFLKNFTKFARSHFGEYVGRRLPVYMASFVVWFATGIWHGANWNFILWGLCNWIILMVAEEIEPACEKMRKEHHLDEKFVYGLLQMLRTFLMVTCLNLFDCYATVGQTLYAFGSIFTAGNWSLLFKGALTEIGLTPWNYLVLGVGIIMMFGVSLYEEKKGSVREAIATKSYALQSLIWCGLLLLVLVFGTYGIGYDSSQFIYNRF